MIKRNRKTEGSSNLRLTIADYKATLKANTVAMFAKGSPKRLPKKEIIESQVGESQAEAMQMKSKRNLLSKKRLTFNVAKKMKAALEEVIVPMRRNYIYQATKRK